MSPAFSTGPCRKNLRLAKDSHLNFHPSKATTLHGSFVILSSKNLNNPRTRMQIGHVDLFCIRCVFLIPKLVDSNTQRIQHLFQRSLSSTTTAKLPCGHSSPTLLSPTLLYNTSTTLLHNTLLQHFSTTLFSNAFQLSSPTTFSNTCLQRFSTSLLYNTSLQDSSPTCLSNKSTTFQVCTMSTAARH